MAEKKTVVFGVFQTQDHAERSEADLLTAGYLHDAITILRPDEWRSEDFPGTGIPEREARQYVRSIGERGVLLFVRCETPNEVARAEELLQQRAARDIWSIDAEPPDNSERRYPVSLISG